MFDKKSASVRVPQRKQEHAVAMGDDGDDDDQLFNARQACVIGWRNAYVCVCVSVSLVMGAPRLQETKSFCSAALSRFRPFHYNGLAENITLAVIQPADVFYAVLQAKPL